MGLLELSKERQVFFIVPQESGSGVRRIAEKVSADVTHTSGAHPVFCSSIRQAAAVQDEAVKMADNAGRTGDVSGMQAVVAVTDGGELAAQLAARSPGLKAVSGKRESYAFFLLDYPLGAEEGQREAAQDCGTGSPATIETALVIYGSDKLGTIYGLFHLSELLGVTPYVYWGDADPVSYERITLAAEPGTECTGGKNRYRWKISARRSLLSNTADFLSTMNGLALETGRFPISAGLRRRCMTMCLNTCCA